MCEKIVEINIIMNGFPSVSRIIIEMTINYLFGGKIMKKIFAGIVTMVLVLSVTATTAFAAGRGCGRYFVDEDGDGICDNAGSACGFVDEGGDGVCDNAGSACSFADEDGDGVCDICGTYHRDGAAGAGGGNYVDADGDGACDNYAAGQGRGCRRGCGGRGNGFRGGRCRS